jgi:protein ImuB
MVRVVSLFLPSWPTDRLRRKLGEAAPPADTPLVLIGREGGRRVVLAVDEAARAAGLHVGMPVTQARILVPGLVIRDADPSADAVALERLALWLLQRVAPIVALDSPDGITIDSTGTEHLHGGEPAMLEALLVRLVLSGIAARAAIADSLAAAHALARHAAQPTWIAPPGHDASVLADLPLAALRLPAAMAADLRALGFMAIGDLLAQPRASLTRRFGPELGRRLD